MKTDALYSMSKDDCLCTNIIYIEREIKVLVMGKYQWHGLQVHAKILGIYIFDWLVIWISSIFTKL